jgi:AraC-like DNA-binding protein
MGKVNLRLRDRQVFIPARGKLGQKAKYMIAKENLTISEIAFKVGFSSQAYFSTVFKSNFSMTPTEYKEKMKA